MNYLAAPPFGFDAFGFVIDATGSRVITCSPDDDVCALYNERVVETDGHFACPKCGRLGQRMIEATPKQCGLIDL